MSEAVLPAPAARASPYRIALAAQSAVAACAIGLSVSPLGQVGQSISLALQSGPLVRPLRLAVPALALGLVVGAWLAALGRAAVAWAMTAAGAVAVATVSAGERLATGNTRWMSVYPGVGSEWTVVAVAATMGATAAALVVAAGRSGVLGSVAVAFAVGLILRNGNAWFQARYDVLAALLAVGAALVAGLAPVTSEVDAAGPAGGRRAPWVALAVATGAFAACSVITWTSGDTVWSATSNTPDWAAAARIFLVEAVAVGGALAVLAFGARRFGLGAARHVLTAAALAAGLAVMPSGDGYLHRARVLAVAIVVVAIAWLAPATWLRHRLLPVAQTVGLLLVGVGAYLALAARVGAGAPGRCEYLIAVGAALAATAAVRDVLAGGDGVGRPAVVGIRLGALALLVMAVGAVATAVYGIVAWRVAPGDPGAPAPPPGSFLWLCRTLLLGPVVAAVFTTVRGLRGR